MHHLLVAWAYASTFLLLIVVNAINPGQISAAIPEAGWVILFLLPVIAICGVTGTLRDQLAAALLLILPIPWAASPLSSPLDRHRTEYYDTFAVMAAISITMLLLTIPPPTKPVYSLL